MAVIDAAGAAGWEVVGVAHEIQPQTDNTVPGLPIMAIGTEATQRLCLERGVQAVVAVGDNATRYRVAGALSDNGVTMATIVHPQAVIGGRVTLGAGTVVLAGAVVNADTTIGEHAIINTACSVDHDSLIGNATHISPGAHLGGTVVVGEGAHIDLGACVRNNITIGCWSVVGAGAVVVTDVPERVISFGCPGRIVRSVQT